MISHIRCCIGDPTVSLCGAPDHWDGSPICEECKRLERLDDFCPRSELGCTAVREGAVVQ